MMGKTSRWVGAGAVVCLLPWILSCSSRAVITEDEAQDSQKACEKIELFFKSELEPYQERVDEASRKYQIENWKVETASPDASLKRQSILYESLQSVVYDRTILRKVQNLLKQGTDLKLTNCSALNRLNRVESLLRASIIDDATVIDLEKENQATQDKLQNESNSFRVTIPGEKEPISMALFGKKLASNADRTQREKWFRQIASKRANHWLSAGFRNLIKSRNQEAKAAGFPDYYAYRFFRSSLDLAKYKAFVLDVKQKLAPKATRALKEIATQHGISKVEPWDFRFLREQASTAGINPWLATLTEKGPMDIARKFYSELGFNVDDYGFTTDLLPREGKNTHAFAMAVVFPRASSDGQLINEPPSDIRFLANLRVPVKWDDVGTIIHELGHAIHAAEVRQPIAIFRGFDSVPTEAIAMALGRFAASPQFLQDTLVEFCKVPARDSAAVLKRQTKTAKIDQAFSLMRQVMFSDFEQAIYQNPDADFAKIWAKMTQEYWGIEVPSELAEWDIDHYVMAPVYVQNYALGILIVEQILDSMGAYYSSLSRKKLLGDKLKEIWFQPGLEFDYLQLTERLTGKPLSAAAALKLIE